MSLCLVLIFERNILKIERVVKRHLIILFLIVCFVLNVFRMFLN